MSDFYQELADRLAEAGDKYDRENAAHRAVDKTRGALIEGLARGVLKALIEEDNEVMELIDSYQHALATLVRTAPDRNGEYPGLDEVADRIEPHSFTQWLKASAAAGPPKSLTPPVPPVYQAALVFTDRQHAQWMRKSLVPPSSDVQAVQVQEKVTVFGPDREAVRYCADMASRSPTSGVVSVEYSWDEEEEAESLTPLVYGVVLTLGDPQEAKMMKRGLYWVFPEGTKISQSKDTVTVSSEQEEVRDQAVAMARRSRPDVRTEAFERALGEAPPGQTMVYKARFFCEIEDGPRMELLVSRAWPNVRVKAWPLAFVLAGPDMGTVNEVVGELARNYRISGIEFFEGPERPGRRKWSL